MTEARNAADLKDVQAQIGTSSFMFERSTLRDLRDDGWGAVHGGSYIDPREGKPRERDLHGSKPLTDFDERRWVTIAAIECKREAGFCVVHEVPVVGNEKFETIQLDDQKGLPAGPSLLLEGFVAKDIDRVVVAEDGRCKLNNANSRSTDSVYQRWSQAVSSLPALLLDHEYLARGLQRFTRPVYVLPLAVVCLPEGCLVAQRYGPTGPVDLERVESSLYWIDAPITRCRALNNANTTEFRISAILFCSSRSLTPAAEELIGGPR